MIRSYNETIQKAKTISSDENPIQAYEDLLEDLDYTEQQMILNTHMSLDEFENTDYYELMKIMEAKPRNKRPKNLWDLFDVTDKKKGGK